MLKMIPDMLTQARQLETGVNLILTVEKENLTKWERHRLHIAKMALQKLIKILKEFK